MDEPNDKYPRWYKVTIKCSRKGRKPVFKDIWAKWLPKDKRWVSGNNRTVVVISYFGGQR